MKSLLMKIKDFFVRIEVYLFCFWVAVDVKIRRRIFKKWEKKKIFKKPEEFIKDFGGDDEDDGFNGELLR